MSDRSTDQLVSALLDGSLSEEEAAALSQRIESADPDALADYLDAIAVHTFLRRTLGSVNPTLPTPAAPESAATPESATAPSALPAPPKPHAAAQRGVGVLRPLYALAAAILLFAAAVAIYFATLGPDPTAAPAPVAADDRSVLTLVDATDPVTVGRAPANPGDAYPAGPITLDAGAAEFVLRNGVGVRLRGPAQLVVHDAMHASLLRGSATFDCPPDASGYTVDLPDGSRIVDLGTRFGVDLDADGRCTVRVLHGRVRVTPPADPGRAGGLEFTTGHACLVVSGEVRPFGSIELANPSFEADGSDVRAANPSGWSSDLTRRVFIHPADAKEARVAGADGRFVGTLNAHYAGGGDKKGLAPALWQDTDERVDPDAVYDLTVLVGRRADYDSLNLGPTHWRIELADAQTGRVLASLAGDTPPTGQMVEHRLRYTPEPADAGRPLRVRLVNPQGVDAPGRGKVLFDHVRFTHATSIETTPPSVPDPKGD